MIVRTINEIIGTERDVHAETWVSRRLLLSGDGMGFSMHETIMKAGTATEMWYQNHLEAVYCVDGEGELIDLDHDQTYTIQPGTLYALSGHERHIIRVHKDLRLVCVFNPPVTGREVHDQNGTYPLLKGSDSK